ncbi:YHS domain-containing (seleno)protein [Tenacibaculum soleae]|uniref:YHS domain-containing (seleno)protein n=1 Tax=Tenacibaculum soleae TaxID=447689 RepID=UPI0026E37BAD|nr:YHS domain-containing (seleno)protein [Tenacibaculum soleae]MDO6743278.1 YHS domain-containing (seleno)protein [Tenacibaculum soleae]
MKNLLFLLFITSSFNLAAQKTSYNTKKGFVAEGYDVVSYFVNKKPLIGKKKFQTTYDGVKFKFSSEKNLQTFNESPTKYVPQYGGFCAYAVAERNKKMYIDPKYYEIRDGKLYLFYNPWIGSALENWQEGDVEKRREKGDINWKTLKNK